MSQTEEEDKSLEGDLSKIEKSDLPNRVENNGELQVREQGINKVTEVREQGINKVRILAKKI